MKKLSIGLLIIVASTAFASESPSVDNCVLIGKEKSSGGVIVMPWVRETRTLNVDALSDCIDAGEKFLAETFNRYDGPRYLGKGTYRLVKFEFTTEHHTIEGKIRNR